jgi:hypothetical protein
MCRDLIDPSVITVDAASRKQVETGQRAAFASFSAAPVCLIQWLIDEYSQIAVNLEDIHAKVIDRLKEAKKWANNLFHGLSMGIFWPKNTV